MFEAAPRDAGAPVGSGTPTRKRAVLMIKKKKRTKPGNMDTLDMLQSSGKLPSSIHDANQVKVSNLVNG